MAASIALPEGAEESGQLQRLVRALREILLVDPHRGAEDMADVYSESGTRYTVDLREGVCTCPDYDFNLDVEKGQKCKHILRAEFEIGGRPLPTWANTDAIRDDRLRAALGLDEDDEQGGAVMPWDPYPEPEPAASHFCDAVGATVYCDAVDCPYCDVGDAGEEGGR